MTGGAHGFDHAELRLPFGCESLIVNATRLHHLAHAPVDDLHFAKAADHDVRRLQVAVHDTAHVRVGERLADVFEDRQERASIAGRRLPLGELFRQGLALDEFHAEERLAVDHAEVIDRHDAGVLELAADLRLFDEALQNLWSVLVLLVQELHGDVAAEVLVVTAVHRADTAAA